jgi:formylmethanofuran dehydrogenase subunit E
MDKTEAFRSIQYDLLEYIQKRVWVDFDNAMQNPVGFYFKGEKYVVHEVLGRFRTHAKHHINAFLVNANDDEVYFLYFQLCNMDQRVALNPGFWVLSFRIFNDRELMSFYREDRKMLVNMTLKRVIDFHGHLCPDLVLGGKACEYVQKLFSENKDLEAGVTIIAENCTSALDAIQILLGATVGNQRLQVMDFGKHNYMFLFKTGHNSIKLSLRRQHYGDEDEYRTLEQKIMKDQVTLEEVVDFQKILDSRVKQLLTLLPEDLFDIELIEPIQQPTETATIYLSCSKCGQQVLRSRTINYKDEIYCIPCFQRNNTGCMYHSLQ